MAGSTRRANHEGTFERLPSGKYRCVAQVDGRKVRGEAAETKKQAALNLRLAIKGLNVEKEAAGLSLLSLAHSWLASKTKYAKTTRETYGYWIATLERDPIASVKVSKLTSSQLDAWRDRQNLANETVRKRCQWINQLCRYAKVEARVTPPPPEEHDRRPITPTEESLFDEVIASRPANVILAALIAEETGLRRSEVCGLMHEDRDGSGVWVRRAVTVTQGEITVSPKRGNKKKKGGWVPLSESLREIIGTGSGFIVGEGTVPMNPKTLSWHIRQIKKGTGLQNVPYFGLHALRRTYGRKLLETGADVPTAAQAMRHDPEILMKDYAKSRQDLMLSAVDRAFGSGANALPPGTARLVEHLLRNRLLDAPAIAGLLGEDLSIIEGIGGRITHKLPHGTAI